MGYLVNHLTDELPPMCLPWEELPDWAPEEPDVAEPLLAVTIAAADGCEGADLCVYRLHLPDIGQVSMLRYRELSAAPPIGPQYVRGWYPVLRHLADILAFEEYSELQAAQSAEEDMGDI